MHVASKNPYAQIYAEHVTAIVFPIASSHPNRIGFVAFSGFDNVQSVHLPTSSWHSSSRIATTESNIYLDTNMIRYVDFRLDNSLLAIHLPVYACVCVQSVAYGQSIFR